jgi:toxin ParE1/3/4
MSLPVVLTPEAKDEYDEAHARYESTRKGLGKRFRLAVKESIRRIQRIPRAKGIIHPPDVRRSLVEKFPYVVVYRLTAHSIRIISVFHTSRDPAKWQHRADKDREVD